MCLLYTVICYIELPFKADLTVLFKCFSFQLDKKKKLTTQSKNLYHSIKLPLVSVYVYYLCKLYSKIYFCLL